MTSDKNLLIKLQRVRNLMLIFFLIIFVFGMLINKYFTLQDVSEVL